MTLPLVKPASSCSLLILCKPLSFEPDSVVALAALLELDFALSGNSDIVTLPAGDDSFMRAALAEIWAPSRGVGAVEFR
jgi:hypothetical protein